MPYLALLGLLALWLTPALVARAEEPPSPASAPPAATEAAAPLSTSTATEIPADYPEDFSPPDEVIAARENRYEAFGEDDVTEQAPGTASAPSAAAASLNDPIE